MGANDISLAPAIQELESICEQISDYIMTQEGQDPPTAYNYQTSKYEKLVRPSGQIVLVNITHDTRTKSATYVTQQQWDNKINKLAGVLGVTQELPRPELSIKAENLSDIPGLLPELYYQMFGVLTLMQATTQSSYTADLKSQGRIIFGKDFQERMAVRGIGREPNEEGHKKAYIIPSKEQARVPKFILEDITWDTNKFEALDRTKEKKKAGPSPLRKWECECTIIRSSSFLSAVCDICGEPFEYADKNDEPNSFSYERKNAVSPAPSWWINARKSRVQGRSFIKSKGNV